MTGSLRLIARGVNPVVVSALKVDQLEVSSSQQRAATIFSFIPMFLILATFSAGMQIATDSTAGERERGSLEPLLLNPVARWQLLAGKWLAAATSAMGGMLGTLLVTTAVMSRLSLEDLGVRFHIGWGTTRIAGVGDGSHGTRRAGRSDVPGLLCTVLQRGAGIHGVPRIRRYNARCIVDVLSDGQRALAAMDSAGGPVQARVGHPQRQDTVAICFDHGRAFRDGSLRIIFETGDPHVLFREDYLRTLVRQLVSNLDTNLAALRGHLGCSPLVDPLL